MKLLKQNHVKYGLAMSAVTAFCLLLMEATGRNEAFDVKSPFQLIFMIIAPAVIWFLAIRAKRLELKNKLSYKRGLIEGIKISFVYAVVSPFVFLIYYVLINRALLEYARTSYGLVGAGDTTVIAVDMVVQFFAAMIFGTIYAAIIAFFLKTKS